MSLSREARDGADRGSAEEAAAALDASSEPAPALVPVAAALESLASATLRAEARPSGDDAYDSFILGLGDVSYAATLILLDPTASSEPFVLRKIAEASSIFFAGGLDELLDPPVVAQVDHLGAQRLK